MKKVIYLFIIMFVLVVLIGCSDDSNGGISIPTGIDFSSDEMFNDVDSYLAIDGIDSDFRLMIASKNEIISTELTINGNVIDIDPSWFAFSESDDYFPFIGFVDDSMLPDGMVIGPGVELDVHFTLNGTSFNHTVTVPQIPSVETQTLYLQNDFTINWTLSQDPQVQIVELSAESFFWDDDYFFFCIEEEVSASARSYRFSSSIYSAYVDDCLGSYEYGVEAINYEMSGKHIIVVTTDDFIEGSSFKVKDPNTKVKKTHKLIRSLVE